MSIQIDEPLAVMAATAFAAFGAAIGMWWQRRRAASSPAPSIDSADVRAIEARFDHLDLVADTMALEIERMTEGQRFMTKLLSERAAPSALPPTIADPSRQRTPH